MASAFAYKPQIKHGLNSYKLAPFSISEAGVILTLQVRQLELNATINTYIGFYSALIYFLRLSPQPLVMFLEFDDIDVMPQNIYKHHSEVVAA